MNPHDPGDTALSAAFRARLDAAPEPSDALLARTLAAIDPPRRAERRWRPAMAGPARFAAAAAIVIVGGTIAFGTVRAGRETSGAFSERSPAMVTFERTRPEAVALVRSGALTLRVGDVGRAARRIGTLAHREGGTATSGRASADGSIHLLLRVPAGHFDRTLVGLDTLGTVAHHEVHSADMTAAVTNAERDLHAAEARERELRAAHDVPGLADVRASIVRLQSRKHALDARLAEATIDVVLQPAGSALGDEPSSPRLRPTRISLAAEIRDEAHLSLRIRDRIRSIAAPASGRRAAGSNSGDA